MSSATPNDDGIMHADGGDGDLAAVPGMHGTVGAQGDESAMDQREDADDDLGKGRIKFPDSRLYGREEELAIMRRAYEEVASSSADDRVQSNNDVFSSIPADSGGNGIGENTDDGQNSLRGGGTVEAIFLAGKAGTGKSSMVTELLRRIEAEVAKESALPGVPRKPVFASGKFGNAASDPMSAVAEAFAILASRIAEESESSGPDVDSRMGMGSIRARMNKAGLSVANPTGAVLLRSFPGVAPLLTPNSLSPTEDGSTTGGVSVAESPSVATRSVGGRSTLKLSVLSSRAQDAPHLVRSAARLFLSALFGGKEGGFDRPLILFLDDLQWADDASIALLSSLLTRGGPDDLVAPLRHILFIGAYRDNEVNDQHPLNQVISRATESLGTESVRHIQLAGMTRSDVRNFVGDCVEKPPYEVLPLADAVYDRTMGNAFFVRQAMEELVRRNVLYYDVIFYEWRWNVEDNAMDLGENLTLGVREILQAKLIELPEILTRALILAACTQNNFDAETVLAMLEAENPGAESIEISHLLSLLNFAVAEGLLLRYNYRRNRRDRRYRYSFAHDQIRDAARSFVDDEKYLGRERRDLLRVRIAGVLQSLHAAAEEAAAASEQGCEAEDWMLFVAADHMNAIPRDAESAPPAEDLAQLNLRVAEMSRFKAAFGQAIELLRFGISCLGGDGGWSLNYGLALDLHNLLLRIEYAKGNYAAAKEVAEQVISNAQATQDMFVAHLTLVQNISQEEEKDYDLATKTAVETLRLHGHRFPQRPSKVDIMREKTMLKFKLRGQPVRTIAEIPHVMEDDEPLMMLLEEAATTAIFCQNQQLALMIALRALRISLVKGVSKYLASLAVVLGLPFREEEKFHKAFVRGSLALNLLNRLAEEKGHEYALAEYRIHNSLLQLQQSFKDSLDTYVEVYEIFVSNGSVDMALTVPMNYVFCCFAEGYRLESTLETKLCKSESQARALGRPSMVLIFQLCRQFLLNLQGKGSRPPTKLKGRAYDEEKILQTLEGNNKKMMLRDTNIFRLHLAVIFGDLSAMESALEQLISFPVYERLIVRQHLRLSFVGLAAFILGRQKKKKKYTKVGHRVLRHFERLNKSGSINAYPVYWCLVAAKIPGEQTYSKAIQACSSSQVLHLEALMTEHFGLFFKDRNNHNKEVEYLKKSLALYTDWGALAKVNQLRDQHDFLRRFNSQHLETRGSSAKTFSIKEMN